MIPSEWDRAARDGFRCSSAIRGGGTELRLGTLGSVGGGFENNNTHPKKNKTLEELAGP
jgi:hypothetical protein